MKHVLCIYLPHWPIDRLRRRRPALRHKALVLVETTAQRQTIVHVSPEAPAEIHPGMALAAARARHAMLLDFPATPEADLRSLEALGHWLLRFSPNVSVYLPAALFLDATGLAHLFGSLENLRDRIAEALAALRITASVAIAPTPGAAWALAAFGKAGPYVICDDQVRDALAPLPPEALRLESATVELLRSLGVHTIRDLLALPRGDLATRFGPAILQRIDQALGTVHEPLLFLPHRAPVKATLEFETALESLDVIRLAVQELTREIARQLAQRGLGARELHLTFRQPYSGPIEKIVQLVRSCRNESALFKLLSCALEHLESHEGILAATLTVSVFERLGDPQAALLDADEERNAAELDGLIERLRARLDRTPQNSGHAVEWGELVESNLPELAFRSGADALVGRRQLTKKPTRASAPHSANEQEPGTADAPRKAVDLLRPLRLLCQPRPIQAIVRPLQSRAGQPVSFTDGNEVHRLDHIRGPERITGQWWNGRWKTRDYFDVLDIAGDRYWIFRVAQTGRWFLHGIFE